MLYVVNPVATAALLCSLVAFKASCSWPKIRINLRPISQSLLKLALHTILESNLRPIYINLNLQPAINLPVVSHPRSWPSLRNWTSRASIQDHVIF